MRRVAVVPALGGVGLLVGSGELELPRRGRRVARRVGRPHAERVGAVREVRVRLVACVARARAEAGRAGVDRALERGRVVRRREAEGGTGVVDLARGAAVDRHLRRLGVHGEGARRGGRVARGVRGGHAEGVVAVGEAGGRLVRSGARAGGERRGACVDRAGEGGGGVGRTEGEVRLRAVSRAARAGVDRHGRRLGINGEGARRGRGIDAGGVTGAGVEGVATVGESGERLRRGARSERRRVEAAGEGGRRLGRGEGEPGSRARDDAVRAAVDGGVRGRGIGDRERDRRRARREERRQE